LLVSSFKESMPFHFKIRVKGGHAIGARHFFSVQEGKYAEGSSRGIEVSVGKFCPDNKTRRGGTARIGNKRARPTLSR
jgi:hypothetical protein